MAIQIPKPEVKGFVIYNPELNLFSTGGSSPKWKKKPKIWTNIGHLKNHLHASLDRGSRWRYGQDTKTYSISNIYRNCVIYDIVTDQRHDLDIYDYIEKHVKESYYGRQGYTIIYE